MDILPDLVYVMFDGVMWLILNPFIRSFLQSQLPCASTSCAFVQPCSRAFVRSCVLSLEGHVGSVRLMGQSLLGALPRTVFTRDLSTPGGVVPPYPGLFTGGPFRAINDRRMILFIQSVISIGYSTRLSLCYVRRCDVAHT